MKTENHFVANAMLYLLSSTILFFLLPKMTPGVVVDIEISTQTWPNSNMVIQKISIITNEYVMHFCIIKIMLTNNEASW